jgi:hypothetical protein
MRRIVMLVVGTAAVLSLNGCMMAGGMGGVGGMHGVDSARPSQASVVGEVRTATASVVLEFPAVAAGDNATILVTVRDAASGKPITGGTVRVLVRGAGSGAGAIIVPVTHTMPGTFEATHRFETPGAYSATAEVLPDGGSAGAAARVTVRQEVAGAAQNHGRRSPHLAAGVLGGAAMVAMMVAMLAR